MSRGIVFAIFTALVSGVAVFLNGIAVKLSEPLAYTLLKNSGALLFLLAAVFAIDEWKSFRGLSRRQWGYLVLIGLVGGSIPFAMFFTGLSMGGPVVSSFLFRSLFVFAGVFGYLLLRERPEPKDYAAGFIILLGNALIVPLDAVFGMGQLLVLGATVLWALEYAISRKILAEVAPRAVMVSRMLFGSLVLLGYLAATGSLGSVLTMSGEALGWLAVTSLLLFGFLTCWYNALKRLPVLKATAVLASGGIVTAALNLIFLGEAVTLTEGLGLVLILIGAAVMVSITDILNALQGNPRKSLVG